MNSSNTNEFLAAGLEALCRRTCQAVNDRDFHSSPGWSHMAPIYRVKDGWLNPFFTSDQDHALGSLTLQHSLDVQKDLVANYPEYRPKITDMATVVDAKCSTGEAQVSVNFELEGMPPGIVKRALAVLVSNFEGEVVGRGA